MYNFEGASRKNIEPLGEGEKRAYRTVHLPFYFHEILMIPFSSSVRPSLVPKISNIKINKRYDDLKLRETLLHVRKNIVGVIFLRLNFQDTPQPNPAGLGSTW